MRHWRLVALIVVFAGIGATRYDAWTQGGALLFPDLAPWIKPGVHLGDAKITGVGAQRRLVFTGTTVNQGAGRFELRQGAVPGIAYQWIYDAAGGHVETPIGQFEVEDGEPLHFRGFTKYNLRAVSANGGVGPVVVSSPKAVFSPHDSVHYDKTLPGASLDGQYFRTPPFDSNHLVGVSVGWADIYAASDPMQYIPLASVPDGDYWLEMIVDPDNQLRESDKGNNVGRILVRIRGGEVSLPPAPAPAPAPIRVASDGVSLSPNPWRSDRHAGPIVFGGLAPGAEVRIFGLSGRWVRTLGATAGTATWDLKSDSGEEVTSGYYFYRTTGADGSARSGRFAVIR